MVAIGGLGRVALADVTPSDRLEPRALPSYDHESARARDLGGECCRRHENLSEEASHDGFLLSLSHHLYPPGEARRAKGGLHANQEEPRARMLHEGSERVEPQESHGSATISRLWFRHR